MLTHELTTFIKPVQFARKQNNGTDSKQVQAVDGKQRIYLEWSHVNNAGDI